MAQTGKDFLAATSTLTVSSTPTGDTSSAATIDTPDTLPPLWPAGASSEVRPLSFTADLEVPTTDESARAATTGEGTSSRRFLSRGAAQESDIVSRQSTGTAALDATGGDELGRGAPEGRPEEPPTKSVLLQRTTAMFLQGKGRLNASGGEALIFILTRRVLLDASEVITDFDVQRLEVHEACGQKLDAREGLAFLLGDVMLGARIPDESARKLGDWLGKLVFSGPPPRCPKRGRLSAARTTSV